MKKRHYLHESSSQKNGQQLQSLPAVHTAQPSETDEGGLDLVQLVAAVRRRIFLVAGVTVAVAATALAQALTITPTYEAKFELLTDPVTAENKLLSSLPQASNNANQQATNTGVNETELKVLQSPKLMSPIVERIKARYPSREPLKLSINAIDKTNILEVTYQDPDPEKVKFVLNTVAQAYLAYSLEQRQADISQGIKFVQDQLPELQTRVKVLQERLQKFRQQYDIIDPRGQGEKLSSQLNAVGQQRIDIQTQLAKARALYATLQRQLGLQQNEAVAASALSEAPRYQSLLNQLQILDTQIAVQSARYHTDSPTIRNLRDQRQNLLPLVEQAEQRLLLTKRANTIAEENRDLASPNSIRSQQVQQALDAARQIKALEAQDKALGQAEARLRQQVKQFPLLARENDELERQLKIAVENLNQFWTKREALRIDAAQKQVPWQLLTPPTEPKSASSNAQRMLMLGIALGFLLGIGVALVVDKFNNFFYNTKDIKEATKLLVLGEIPFVQEKESGLAAGVVNFIPWLHHKFRLGRRDQQFEQQNSIEFWESLRSLYTSIRFLNFDIPVRSLALISATPEDGRSTIAVHLAQVAAAMGQRVLLVDADLRHPQLHAMLGLPNTTGLSNVIAENRDFQQVIQQPSSILMQTEYNFSWEDDLSALALKDSPLENNLFVLTAGQVPPNPASLLSSQKMQNLAKQFQEVFDLVIYDTSPLLGLADTNLLAAHTNAALLVVRIGKTKRSALLKVLEGLKISHIPVLGAVANGVER